MINITICVYPCIAFLVFVALCVLVDRIAARRVKVTLLEPEKEGNDEYS